MGFVRSAKQQAFIRWQKSLWPDFQGPLEVASSCSPQLSPTVLSLVTAAMIVWFPRFRLWVRPVSKRLTREGRLGKPQVGLTTRVFSPFKAGGGVFRTAGRWGGPDGTRSPRHGWLSLGPSRSRSPWEVCQSPRTGPEARPVRGTPGDPGGRHSASPTPASVPSPRQCPEPGQGAPSRLFFTLRTEAEANGPKAFHFSHL